MRSLKRWNRLAGVVALAAFLATALAAGAARAEDNPWDAGSNWVSIRGGYARNAADGAGRGGAGAGIGASHMLSTTRVSDWEILGIKPLGLVRWTLFKQFSIGGYVHYDVVSHFGEASEVEIPASVELVRHFAWRTAPKPYLGLGVGPFFRKTYNTGSDFSRVAVSAYLTTGANMVIAPGQLLGVDVRLARVDSENSPENPVFGRGQVESNHWSVKLNYSVAY